MALLAGLQDDLDTSACDRPTLGYLKQTTGGAVSQKTKVASPAMHTGQEWKLGIR
jgi:hypothetical protein